MVLSPEALASHPVFDAGSTLTLAQARTVLSWLVFVFNVEFEELPLISEASIGMSLYDEEPQLPGFTIDETCRIARLIRTGC